MLIKNDFEVAAAGREGLAVLRRHPAGGRLPARRRADRRTSATTSTRGGSRSGWARSGSSSPAPPRSPSATTAAKRIVVDAAGAEREGPRPGRHGRHRDAGPAGRGTKVGVAQDLQLAGAAAQYGRGMISDVTAVLMRDFSANMADPDRRPPSAASPPRRRPPPRRPAASRIGLRAAMMALQRVFRRASSCPTSPTRAEEETTHGLWWIGNAVLLVVVLPVAHRPAQPRARRAGADPRRDRRHPGRRGRPDRRAGRRARRRWPRPTPPSRKSPSARSATRARSRSCSAERERRTPCQPPPG